MIADEIISRALELVDAGYNNSQVASRTGIDRGTVARIRSGERLPKSPYERTPYSKPEAKKETHRCSVCGGLVDGKGDGECIVCRVRKSNVESECTREDDGDLSMKLEGEAARRYLAIQRQSAQPSVVSQQTKTARSAVKVEVLEPRHHGYLGYQDGNPTHDDG